MKISFLSGVVDTQADERQKIKLAHMQERGREKQRERRGIFLRRLLAEKVSNTGDSKAKGTHIYVCVCVYENIRVAIFGCTPMAASPPGADPFESMRRGFTHLCRGRQEPLLCCLHPRCGPSVPVQQAPSQAACQQL